LRGIESDRRETSRTSAIAASNAFRDAAIESIVLTGKLFDNTHTMWRSAATNKDAKDVSRTLSAYLNASYRDLAENAETVSRIWRRYFRQAAADAAAARVGI
jgi:hypothetical protein